MVFIPQPVMDKSETSQSLYRYKEAFDNLVDELQRYMLPDLAPPTGSPITEQFLNIDGSNADQEIDIGVYDFKTSGFVSGRDTSLRITSGATLTYDYEIIYCDTDAGGFTVDLPVGAKGRRYKIINTGTSGNDVTIDGSGSEKVFGELTQDLYDGEILDMNYDAIEGWF